MMEDIAFQQKYGECLFPEIKRFKAMFGGLNNECQKAVLERLRKQNFKKLIELKAQDKRIQKHERRLKILQSVKITSYKSKILFIITFYQNLSRI